MGLHRSMIETTQSPRTLADMAHVIRSKNAGPTQLTIDVLLIEAADYVRAANSPAMSCAALVSRYGLPVQQVQRHVLADLRAIKYVLPRATVAGSLGDGDFYGAQQHGPMLDIVP